jgi:hypothetical protein
MTSEPSAGASSPAASSPELRASHADRDRVVEVLRVAAGDGRLTSDELDQRLEAALTARTYRELAELTADLPPSPAAASARAVPAEPKDLVRIHCMASNAKRDGSWVVPREMEISAVGGSVKLDFTQAVITQPALRIKTTVQGGSLVLVTKPGIVVDAEAVSLVAGSVKVRPPAGPQQPVILGIEVLGHNFGGSIVARPPRRTFWEWLRRRSGGRG